MQTYQLEDLSSVRDRLNKVENEKLSIILTRLEKGNDEVLVTPVGERVGPHELFLEWEKIINSNSSKINAELNEIEENQKNKFGPRSRALPFEDIRDNVLKSYTQSSHSCEHVGEVPPSSLDKGVIRPMSVQNVIKQLKFSTNSGLPLLSRTGNVIDEIVANYYSDLNDDWPMVPFVRTQEQYKTRIVKGYPKSDIINEARYFYPLFEYYRKLPCYAAMNGPEYVNRAMTKLIAQAVRLGYECVSGDVSNFDDSFGIPLQKKCFAEMKYLIQSDYQDDYFGMDMISYRFGNKEFVIPDGVLIGSHGIPSGSQFTNLVGSVGNRKVCDVPLEFAQFLGDDLAAICPDAEKLFDNYTDCGLEMNRDKTLVSGSYFVYLQNLFHPDYMRDGEIKGVYPTWRALNRLIYPERFSEFHNFGLDGKSYFAIRSLSILENCRYHPLFEDFVRFWLRFERYAVPSKQSIRHYVKYMRETSGSLGTTNQLGDNIQGLTNFESYKLAVKYGDRKSVV